jgi:hypothetical protein
MVRLNISKPRGMTNHIVAIDMGDLKNRSAEVANEVEGTLSLMSSEPQPYLKTMQPLRHIFSQVWASIAKVSPNHT